MFKSKLQEYCHSKAWVLPVYGAVTREGPDRCPRFKAVVDVNGISFTSPPNCNTSKEAQNLAAKLAFEYFTGCLNIDIPVTCSPVLSNVQLPETQQTAPAICDGANRDVEDNNMFKDGKHMYKNQLQHYAQKRNLELPKYSVERIGPSHASRFKCKVTVEDKTYESEDYFYTLKEAESAAAKCALASIFPSGFEEDDPSIYKNLLQQLLQKELKELSCFPKYTTALVGPPHNPIFISMVEAQGETFRGQEAKTKKQAEMNAAKVAYITLRERKCKQDDGVNALASHMKETLQCQLSSASVPEVGSNAQLMFDKQVNCNQGKCRQDDSANALVVHMKETLRLSSASISEGGSAAKPMIDKQFKSNQDNAVAATPSNSSTGMPEARNSFNGIQEPKATQSASETISCSNSLSSCSSSKSVDGLHGSDKDKKKKKKKKIMVLPLSSKGSHPDASVVHCDEKWIAFATDSS